MKFREKRERLLVGLYRAGAREGIARYYDAKMVADELGLPRGSGELRAMAHDLQNSGYADASFSLGGGDESGISLRLTGSGIEQAEELADDHPEYERPPQSEDDIPAAGRYVRIDDNQRAEVLPQLEAVRRAIKSSNEAGEEERLVALSELAAFEATFIQPRVSTELIERFANKVMAWLLKVFGEAVVGAAATALIAKLLLLISGG